MANEFLLSNILARDTSIKLSIDECVNSGLLSLDCCSIDIAVQLKFLFS